MLVSSPESQEAFGRCWEWWPVAKAVFGGGSVVAWLIEAVGAVLAGAPEDRTLTFHSQQNLLYMNVFRRSFLLFVRPKRPRLWLRL